MKTLIRAKTRGTGWFSIPRGGLDGAAGLLAVLHGRHHPGLKSERLWQAGISWSFGWSRAADYSNKPVFPAGSKRNTDRRQGERRDHWRDQVRQLDDIAANLVAAIVGKPIPVTGYALPHEAADRPEGGAKSTHLAVPAGAVYYFECADEAAAKTLAAALNWHGAIPSEILNSKFQIKNRRSTLMGEKGFGLGVCRTWDFLSAPT